VKKACLVLKTGTYNFEHMFAYFLCCKRLPEASEFTSRFLGVRITRSLVLCVMFYRSLFVLLSFLFCQLCCLSFDFWILITPLVFSNYFYSWHKRNLFASMKSSGLLIRNMLQSESWELTDVISLNAVT
jgi:hypothetical protein